MEVQVQNLSMAYPEATEEALKNISFSVPRGELFGLIGPDGAGKTTLFRLLTTLLIPTSGQATVCGFDTVTDYKEIRKLVGYMPGRFSLYQDLSVQENLEFFASVFGTKVENNLEMIHDIYVQIEPFKDRPAGKLSGGMKQKLALCCALIHKPQVLFLDEPTTGVDPVSRREFWAILKKLKDLTILVSTPYMDEASLCDRIALIHKGNMLKIDTLDAITSTFDKTIFEVKGDNLYALSKQINALPEVEACFMFGDALHVTASERDINSVSEKLKISCRPISPGIEDIFISLSHADH